MNLGLGINIGGRAAGGFSPALLFAASEPGVWYDPSDLSTMYQDSAGVTPVTAVGQSVGFLGDKSRGFALGSELVSNGTFDSGTTGWSRGFNSVDGTFTASAGVATYTVGAGDGVFPRMVTAISGLTVGRFYRIRFDEVSATGAGDRLVVWTSTADGTGGTSINQVTAPNWSAESKSYFYPATATTMYLAVSFASTSAGATLAIDNISVRELPGNHATQSTAASRPTLGRVPVGGRRNLLTFTEQFDNAAWTKNALTVTANNTAAPDGTATADLAVPTTANAEHYVDVASTAFVSGTAYSLSVYAKASGYKWLRLAFSSSVMPASERAAWFDVDAGTLGTVQTNVTANIVSVGNGWYRCSISRVATSSATPAQSGFILITNADNATSFTGNGTSGMHWWGAQLEVGSTATAYQRVVTAFDVTQAGVADCYYLSFDGSDDFMLTGTITPGTDKAQVFTGLRKLSDAAQGTAVAFGSVGADAGSFELGSPSGAAQPNYAAQLRGNSGLGGWTYTTYTAPITNVVTNLFNLADVTASGQNKVSSSFNGVVNTGTWSTGNAGVGNFGAYPLYLGRRATFLHFNGQLFSLVTRFGANLTADQITQAERFVAGKTGVVI
jgi:hypothetical protein